MPGGCLVSSHVLRTDTPNLTRTLHAYRDLVTCIRHGRWERIAAVAYLPLELALLTAHTLTIPAVNSNNFHSIFHHQELNAEDLARRTSQTPGRGTRSPNSWSFPQSLHFSQPTKGITSVTSIRFYSFFPSVSIVETRMLCQGKSPGAERGRRAHLTTGASPRACTSRSPRSPWLSSCSGSASAAAASTSGCPHSSTADPRQRGWGTPPSGPGSEPAPWHHSGWVCVCGGGETVPLYWYCSRTRCVRWVVQLLIFHMGTWGFFPAGGQKKKCNSEKQKIH